MAIKNLMCDADGCGHVQEIEKLSRELIGMKCQLCGENMLTEAEFLSGLKVEGMIDLLVKLGLATDEENATENHVKVEINPHGGDLNMKIKGVK